MRHESSVPVLASGVVWLILASPALGEERANAPSHGSHGSNDSNDSPSSDADAALSGLFGSPRVTVDPGVAHLEALMAELSERPAAKTAGKPGLDRARAELSRLRRMIDERADATAIARRKQIVWAALSSSDRQMARAELAAALRTAISRREAAEEQLRAAKVASAAHRAELEAQKVPQTTEPAK
jgi:hypothetical protein